MFVVKIWVWGWKERGPKNKNYFVNISSNSKKEHVLCRDGVVVNNKIMCSNVNKITIKFQICMGKKINYGLH